MTAVNPITPVRSKTKTALEFEDRENVFMIGLIMREWCSLIFIFYFCESNIFIEFIIGTLQDLISVSTSLYLLLSTGHNELILSVY